MKRERSRYRKDILNENRRLKREEDKDDPKYDIFLVEIRNLREENDILKEKIRSLENKLLIMEETRPFFKNYEYIKKKKTFNRLVGFSYDRFMEIEGEISEEMNFLTTNNKIRKKRVPEENFSMSISYSSPLLGSDIIRKIL